MYRLKLAVRNSAFCEASLNPGRMQNDLILLIQPMLNMKDIGRHDFHIVNSYLRSLSFKNGWCYQYAHFHHSQTERYVGSTAEQIKEVNLIFDPML